ncbi:hypothetical protein [Streptomyces sp. SID3343]|uniref:hypothetical protein n=1 Tax=Streptomyces sp. SID3343 TaxID=2690260 RepID=UPI00136F4B28|nr:hypothetical protein [Streptomyces sp. SID3343]MYW01507.1 hypothetical protein [Streptomyces sp. SID3343]
MTERGPQDTPLEDLLRAALSARAEQITTGALRAPAPPVAEPASGNRLRTIGIPLAIVATIAAAYGAVSLVSTPSTDDSAPARLPTAVASAPAPNASVPPDESVTVPPVAGAEASTEAPPETTPVAPATAATTSPGTSPPATSPSSRRPSSPTTTRPPTTTPPSTQPTRITDARGIKVRTEADWREQTAPPATSERSYKRCFGPTGAGECDLNTVSLRADDVDDPNAWPYAAIDENPSMWATQLTCAKDGAFYNPRTADGVTSTSTGKQNRTVGGRSAVYREVAVTCAQGQDFKVRVWVIADQGVTVFATSTNARVDAGIDRIVSTLDLSGYAPKKWTGG